MILMALWKAPFPVIVIKFTPTANLAKVMPMLEDFHRGTQICALSLARTNACTLSPPPHPPDSPLSLSLSLSLPLSLSHSLSLSLSLSRKYRCWLLVLFYMPVHTGVAECAWQEGIYTPLGGIILWGCTSGGVYVPCIYWHARWELL